MNLIKTGVAISLLGIASVCEAFSQPATNGLSLTISKKYLNLPVSRQVNREKMSFEADGMVYLDGEYHLFYQHNPFESEWENMSWGHTVSKDLIHWEELPVVMVPDQLGTIFSGTAVIDYKNTSGFGNVRSFLNWLSMEIRTTKNG